LKQRMQRRDWSGEHPPATGTVVRNDDGKAVGEIVTAVCHHGRVSALLVLRTDHAGDLVIDDQTLESTAASLPYALPAPTQQQ
ncbi:MAG: folate-binding protein, partial [Alcanivoracaceae bacterium]|nr:folate-binding protein [Alcanivoracaceae bacterium]